MPDPDHLWAHPTLLSAQYRADNNPNWPRNWDTGYARGNSQGFARGMLSAQI